MNPATKVNPETVVAAPHDEAAFADLYKHYGERIYNFVLRSVRDPHGAEDVCQEVWFKAYREVPKLREPGAFTTWLYRIAARACVDRSRSRSSREAAELPEELPGRDGDRPEQTAIRNDDVRLAWEALGSLPVRQHQALFLREVEGRAYREIATILETTESAVETLLFRARTGMAEAYARLDAAMSERCGQARKSMAVVIDGEATRVQRNAVAAHMNGCSDCRVQLGQMRRASAAYSAIPLLPVPALLGGKILGGLGSATVSTAVSSGGVGLLAKLLALGGTNVKVTTAAFTITGGLVAGAVIVPSDAPAPYAPPAIVEAVDSSVLAASSGTSPVTSRTGVAASSRAADASEFTKDVTADVRDSSSPADALVAAFGPSALGDSVVDAAVANAIDDHDSPIATPRVALPSIPTPLPLAPSIPEAPLLVGPTLEPPPVDDLPPLPPIDLPLPLPTDELPLPLPPVVPLPTELPLPPVLPPLIPTGRSAASATTAAALASARHRSRYSGVSGEAPSVQPQRLRA